jgi:hypothetical protein
VSARALANESAHRAGRRQGGLEVGPARPGAQARARPVIGSASLGYRLGSGLLVILDAEYATVSRVNPAITPSFAPDGHRTTWGISLRLVRRG